MMNSVKRLTLPPNISKDQKDDGGNFPSVDFCGFEKVPIVICERLDITKLLNYSDQHNYKSKRIEETTNHVAKFLNRCEVKLVRDDLEYLLKVLKENSKSNGLSNPERKTFKCQICEKVYSSEKKFQNHQENKHMMMVCQSHVVKNQKRVSFSDHVIVHEVKEYHRCRKCPKIFEDYKSLKLHTKKVHRKRNCYICYYCSRDFVDRMFFKVHVRLHCDRCGKLLANKKEFSEHRRNVCKVIKKYECKDCREIYLSFMGLKDHTYQHEGFMFVCDICKERFYSKCSVEHHIKFLHTIKRPHNLYNTTGFGMKMLYQCNFCDISSTQQDVLAKHVSTLPDLKNIRTTSYKDYYFCDYCSEQFETETIMLQHKWTHFLKNYSSQDENKDTTNFKRIYKVDEKLPKLLQPKIVLEKLLLPVIPAATVNSTKAKDLSNVTMLPDTSNLSLKKPIKDPIKKKKVIVTKYQCDQCGKYFSTNYCMTRHKHTQHGMGMIADLDLQCNVCEESFAHPSLLRSHTCIRMTIPEMPFDDARSEIHFDNLNEYKQYDTNSTDEDLMTGLDLDIAAPIVQLTEYDNLNIVVNGGSGSVDLVQNESSIFNLLQSENGRVSLVQNEKGHVNLVQKKNGNVIVHSENEQVNLVNSKKIVDSIQNFGFGVIVQEVPIEF